MINIPIIILNYNSSSDCKKIISSLQKQSDVSLEIIVVDNCSSKKGEKEIIKEICIRQNCTFIQAKKNRGYNAGNNIGLRYASEKGYKYALIANPDMEFPQTDYVAKLVSKMEKDEDVVACGSDVITLEGIHQNPRKIEFLPWWHSFDWLFDVLSQKISKKISNKDNQNWISDPSIETYCTYLNGCCLMLRTSFLNMIGYFDEGVFLYGEESILAKQVLLSHKKMLYVPDCLAIHSHQKSKEQHPLVCSRHWKNSKIHFIKHYSGYPFYGKMVALFSLHVYYLFLNTYHKFLLNK